MAGTSGPAGAGKFRKRPVVVDAVQLTRENIVDVMRWVAPAVKVGHAVDVIIDIDTGLTIKTLEGNMTASFGDWVIQGIRGEFYPCKPDIFAETHEPADTPALTFTPAGYCGPAQHTYTTGCDGFHEPGQCPRSDRTEAVARWREDEGMPS